MIARPQKRRLMSTINVILTVSIVGLLAVVAIDGTQQYLQGCSDLRHTCVPSPPTR